MSSHASGQTRSVSHVSQKYLVLVREAHASISAHAPAPETLGTLMSRRERGEIVLREQARALLYLRRGRYQAPLHHDVGRGHHPRAVPDAPVLAVVAARALATEGFLGRSAARAGAYRPGRGRPLPQPVVNLTNYITRSATRRRSAASSPASDTLKYKTALASYAPT